MVSEKKTTLFFLRNEDWKIAKATTEKINKLLALISTSNIAELNKLIYAGTKFDLTKIIVPKRTRTETQNLNGKLDWKH